MHQRHARAYELPPEKHDVYRKAIKLEWVSIGYFVTAVTVVYLTLGSSQAMKAAWVEDILGFVPPIAFLVASRIRYRPPDELHPYGFHGAVSIGFLVAALALFLFGLIIFIDSASKLIMLEHPTIEVVHPFGEPVWLGWFMLAALLYTGAPTVVLGRLKMSLATNLHDKILYADAEMNRADWMTAGAAMLGVIGIRFGLWWADSVAAMVISIDIVRDGIRNLRAATAQLMEKRPMTVGEDRIDPLPARVENELKAMSWVKDAKVRMREEGHVYYGEAFVVPADESKLPQRIEDAVKQLQDLDWRLYDLVISPVPRLEEPQELSEEQPRE